MCAGYHRVTTNRHRDSGDKRNNDDYASAVHHSRAVADHNDGRGGYDDHHPVVADHDSGKHDDGGSSHSNRAAEHDNATAHVCRQHRCADHHSR